MLCNVDKF